MRVAVILIAVMACVVLALRQVAHRAAGESHVRRVAATGAVISLVRLSCLGLLLWRTWSHRSGYDDLLLALPLLPELGLLAWLPWRFGPDFSMADALVAFGFAALLTAGSFLLAVAVESVGRLGRLVARRSQPADDSAVERR